MGARLKNYFLSVLMLLGLSFQVQASWDEAGGVIDTTMTDVIQLLKNEELLLEGNEDQLIDAIDSKLSPVVDFDYMAKVVMGKYYRRASKEQRQEFVGVFKTTMLKTYAKALTGFKVESYTLVAPRKKSPDPKKQIVKVDIQVNDGKTFTLAYYMKKKADGWKLVNAILDGSVNIRLSFKNQFADLMQKNKNNVGKVISVWQDKVDPGKGEA